MEGGEVRQPVNSFFCLQVIKWREKGEKNEKNGKQVVDTLRIYSRTLCHFFALAFPFRDWVLLRAFDIQRDYAVAYHTYLRNTGKWRWTIYLHYQRPLFYRGTINTRT